MKIYGLVEMKKPFYFEGHFSLIIPKKGSDRNECFNTRYVYPYSLK